MGAFTSRQNVAVEETDQSSNQYKYPPRSGNFFGSHFIMGGERFDTPQPESYLFGENSDLNFLGNRPTAFPYPPPQANEPTKTLKSLINIRKESVRFVRAVNQEKSSVTPDIITAKNSHTHSKSSKSKSLENLDSNVLSVGKEDLTSCPVSEGIQTPCSYNIEFTFDSDVKCAITVYYFCTEEVSPSGVTLLPRDGLISETYHYEKGINQLFSQPGHVFNPQLIPEDDLIYNSTKEQYPVVIHCVVEEGNEDCRQSHTTICVIDHHPESNSYVLRALKQKIFVDGLCYLLQEIYGIENKAINKTSIDEEEIDDHGSECVICMSETRDTLILPCRHLCLCNSCADSLRYQANNCPICRAPFRALLQIRAVQKGISSHALHQNTPTGDPIPCDHIHIPPGYIPVSLIEALNGPLQYVTKSRTNDSDAIDGAVITESHKATSPLKPSAGGQRRSKIKKNASTLTNVSETTILAANSTVEIGNESNELKKNVPNTEKQEKRSGQEKLQIVNERERQSLKLSKSKHLNTNSDTHNNSSSSSHNDADEDSENEKLSPLLSPGSKRELSSKSLTKALSIPGKNEQEEGPEGKETVILKNISNSSLKKLKHADAKNTASDGMHGIERTAADTAIAINAEDSDYYTPEDMQNSILSPLCPERSKSGEKLSSIKSVTVGAGAGAGSGSFKHTNSIIKNNLHKKSTSVGNIVGPSGSGNVSNANTGCGDPKGNVSSLPDMLDSPLSSGGNNTASTRSSSDSYSSSSSTKQLLSSNTATAAAANIMLDDKSALQNAVNV